MHARDARVCRHTAWPNEVSIEADSFRFVLGYGPTAQPEAMLEEWAGEMKLATREFLVGGTRSS